MSYHVIYHIISYHIIYHIISYINHITSHHIISYQSYQIFSINFEKNTARDRRNFEERNKDWEPFVTIINYCIINNVY